MNPKPILRYSAMMLLILAALIFSGPAHAANPGLTGMGNNFETYRNADGTNTMTMHPTVVNYYNGTTYAPINRTITPSHYSNYSYEMTQNAYRAYFKNNSNTRDAVMFIKDGYNFSFDIHTSQLHWYNSTLNAIVGMVQEMNPQNTNVSVSGSTAFYPNAWINTNLSYAIYNNMLKETLIIANVSPKSSGVGVDYLQYGSNNYFNNSLQVCADGKCYLHPTSQKIDTNGTIEFRDSNNVTIFYLPVPYLYDSAGYQASGYYSASASNGIIVVNIRIPKTFVDNAIFPIYLDPTATYGPSSSVHKAWKGTHASQPPSSLDPVTTEFTALDYTNVGSSDNQYASAATSGAETSYPTQRFNFTISQSKAYIYNVTIYWEGHATDTGGSYKCRFYFRNFTSNAWKLLGSSDSCGTDISFSQLFTNLNDVIDGENKIALAVQGPLSQDSLGDPTTATIDSDYIYVNITYPTTYTAIINATDDLQIRERDSYIFADTAGLFKFPLSSPPGATIKSAILYLYEDSPGNNFAGGSFLAYNCSGSRLGQNWTESSSGSELNDSFWKTGCTYTGNKTWVTTDKNWYSWDVTNAVIADYARNPIGNSTLRINSSDADDWTGTPVNAVTIMVGHSGLNDDNTVDFNSSEATSGRPYLVVTYVLVPVYLAFVPPTNANNSYTSRNYTYVNFTINYSTTLSTVKLSWNNTNISITELTMVFASNFNNNTDDWSAWNSLNSPVIQKSLGGSPNCSSNVVGHFGGGCSFNGTGWINSTWNVILNMSKKNFTVELWVKTNGVNPAGTFGISSAVAHQWQPSTIWGIFINSTAVPFFYINNRTTNTLVGATTNLSLGAWYHIAGVFNGTHVILYINGQYNSSTACTNCGTYPTGEYSDLLIGGYNGLAWGHNGTIDEMRIYWRALPPQEINASYNAELGKYYANMTHLTNGMYNYYAWANNTDGDYNFTETRWLEIGPAKYNLTFIPPTDDDGAATNRNYTYINVSIFDSLGSQDTFKLSWNYTNITIYDPSLVFASNFDNNTNDWSSYGNNGIFYGAVDCTPNVAGRFITACAFNGTAGNITLNSVPSTNSTTGITISLWINKNVDVSWAGIVTKANPTTSIDYSYTLRADNGGKIQWSVENLTALVTITSPNAIATGGWHQITAAANFTNETRMYIDGALVGVAGIRGSLNGSVFPTLIGGAYNYVTRTLNGSIDEVRIWNRTLTAAEISASYNAELGRYYANITNLALGTYSYYAWGNTTDGVSNFTETRTLIWGGFLEVHLNAPNPTQTTNVFQNRTFVVNASVVCRNGPCGEVFGTVRYNRTTKNPDTPVNTTTGDVPFFVNEVPSLAQKSCGVLSKDQSCNITWVVNATGKIDSSWMIGVLFNSSYSNVVQNHTNNATVSILSCSVDFTLHWSVIEFGPLNPGTENAALENWNSTYNITANTEGCGLDFYIKGTNLFNTTYSSAIGVGNITWSNVTDSYIFSFNLSTTSTPIMKNVAKNTNVTTWYWMNLPPVYAGIYNGTVYITGAINGESV